MDEPKNIEELRDRLLESFAAVAEDPRRIPKIRQTLRMADKLLGTARRQIIAAQRAGETPRIPFLEPTSRGSE